MEHASFSKQPSKVFSFFPIPGTLQGQQHHISDCAQEQNEMECPLVRPRKNGPLAMSWRTYTQAAASSMYMSTLIYMNMHTQICTLHTH